MSRACPRPKCTAECVSNVLYVSYVHHQTLYDITSLGDYTPGDVFSFIKHVLNTSQYWFQKQPCFRIDGVQTAQFASNNYGTKKTETLKMQPCKHARSASIILIVLQHGGNRMMNY